MKKFIKSLRKLIKGYHVVIDLNPFNEKFHILKNRKQLRGEERFLKRKYKLK